MLMEDALFGSSMRGLSPFPTWSLDASWGIRYFRHPRHSLGPSLVNEGPRAWPPHRNLPSDAVMISAARLVFPETNEHTVQINEA